MKSPDIIRYWSIRKKEFAKGVLRFLLHMMEIGCVGGMAILPLLYPDTFSLEKFNYFIFYFYQDTLRVNYLGTLFVAIIILGGGDYYILNLKRIWEPSRKELGSMLEHSATLHLKSAKLCTTALAAIDVINEKNKQKAKYYLMKSMQQILNAIDELVKNYMDTVSEDDKITSNIMIVLKQEYFQDRRTWNPILNKLESERIYSKDSCDNESCTAWLRLIAQCHNSKEHFFIDKFVLRVNKNPILSIAGAAIAYHYGIKFIENEDEDLRLSTVNDVYRIKWPTGIENSAQYEASAHFEKLKFIKSFISVPLTRLSDVVGILNVNSSGFYLAGRSIQQRSILKNLIFPSLSHLSDIIFQWRNLEYGN